MNYLPTIEPIVHGLEEKYGSEIEFEYLNIDDPETASAKREYGFRVQPHLFLVNGEGKLSKSGLEQLPKIS